VPESNTEATIPDEAQNHGLLTLLTVTGLNLGVLQRQLNKDGTGVSAKM